MVFIYQLICVCSNYYSVSKIIMSYNFISLTSCLYHFLFWDNNFL
nr:ALPV-107 [Albatrosspox virus]